MNNFDTTMNFRLSKKVRVKIEKKVKNNIPIYESIGHFLRVAIHRELQREVQK